MNIKEQKYEDEYKLKIVVCSMLLGVLASTVTSEVMRDSSLATVEVTLGNIELFAFST
jgi:hypothetical protein